MKMFFAIHRWKSNAAYSLIGAMAARKPPETGSGNFRIEPWYHIEPIITRMNQMARCPAVRCAGSCCQFLHAIQMLPARSARNNAVSSQPIPLAACSPVCPLRNSQAS
jgi:hypothetical protein